MIVHAMILLCSLLEDKFDSFDVSTNKWLSDNRCCPECKIDVMEGSMEFVEISDDDA